MRHLKILITEECCLIATVVRAFVRETLDPEIKDELLALADGYDWMAMNAATEHETFLRRGFF